MYITDLKDSRRTFILPQDLYLNFLPYIIAYITFFIQKHEKTRKFQTYPTWRIRVDRTVSWFKLWLVQRKHTCKYSFKDRKAAVCGLSNKSNANDKAKLFIRAIFRCVAHQLFDQSASLSWPSWSGHERQLRRMPSQKLDTPFLLLFIARFPTIQCCYRYRWC